MSVLKITDFSGGLNTRFRQNFIADNQTPQCRNIRFRRQGGLSKRFGSSLISVTAAAASTGSSFGCHAYALSGMSAEAMVVFTQESPAAVYKTTDGTTFSNVTGAYNTGESIDLTTKNDLIHFLTFKDSVYAFANYADTRSYDNTTWSRIATANNVFPKSKLGVVHKNRIFSGYVTYGGTTYKSRIKWSDYAANVWTTTNFEDIFADDGTVLIGMCSYGDELIIWKGPENASQSWMHAKMFRVLGDNFDASVQQYAIQQIPMPPGVGLLGPDGWAIHEGRLIFLTNEGFYEYIGGGSAPQDISDLIREDMNELSVSTFNEWDSKPSAFSFDGRFYCTLRSTLNSSEGYVNITYILEEKAWSTDILSSTADSFALGSGHGVQYTKFLGNFYCAPATTATFSGLLTGSLRRIEIENQFQENIGNDSTAYVNASVKTKEFDLGKETFVRSIFIYLRRQSSGTLTFGYNLDQRGETTTSVDMTAGDTGTTESSSSTVLKKEIWIGQICRTIQFRFHDLSNNDFEIYGLEVDYK